MDGMWSTSGHGSSFNSSWRPSLHAEKEITRHVPCYLTPIPFHVIPVGRLYLFPNSLSQLTLPTHVYVTCLNQIKQEKKSCMQGQLGISGIPGSIQTCRPAANTQIRMYMCMARSRTCACTHISCTMISCMCLFKYVRACAMQQHFAFVLLTTYLCTDNLHQNSLKIKLLFYAAMHKIPSNKCPLVELSLSAKQIELDSTNISFLLPWRMHDSCAA